jgi:para-nitrobenzyl esterase
MLAASPEAKGLFHRAISESGGSFAPVRVGNQTGQMVPSLQLAEASGKSLLESLGAKDIKAARALSAEEIQKLPEPIWVVSGRLPMDMCFLGSI